MFSKMSYFSLHNEVLKLLEERPLSVGLYFGVAWAPVYHSSLQYLSSNADHLKHSNSAMHLSNWRWLYFFMINLKSSEMLIFSQSVFRTKVLREYYWLPLFNCHHIIQDFLGWMKWNPKNMQTQQFYLCIYDEKFIFMS